MIRLFRKFIRLFYKERFRNIGTESELGHWDIITTEYDINLVYYPKIEGTFDEINEHIAIEVSKEALKDLTQYL